MCLGQLSPIAQHWVAEMEISLACSLPAPATSTLAIATHPVEVPCKASD
jgi:hypothetical protein